MAQDVIIADRGEFVDVLRSLRRGHVLVRAGEGAVLDGGKIYHSLGPLLRYGLVDEFDNPAGFEGARYYRLSPHGREFAERACQAWQRQPVLTRLAVRLAG
jgi:hypothetical protein